MNEDKFKKGIKDIKNIRLKDEDKSRILRSVLDVPIISPYAPRKYASRVWAILFVLVVVGGTTVYSAEKSLPGDRLYSLKVNFSEPIRDFINKTPEDKAEWESVKVTRRLDEAVDLVIQGKLNEKNRNNLENLFNKHIDSFEATISNASSSAPKTNLVEVEFKANVSAKTHVFESLRKEEDKEEGLNKETDEKDEIKKKNKESREELKKFEDTISDRLKEMEKNRLKRQR